MKKLYTISGISALLALAPLPAAADVISPEAALARAIPEAPTRAAASQYSLLSTIEETTGPAVYIFGDGASSLVVSADDSTIPLLGYSDNAAPTRAGAPLHSPAFEYWVRQYAAQIEWMRLHAPSAAIRATRAGDRAPIGPLVSTRWNQDAPYNDLCPMDNGKRSVTGCVATAMAQVLNAPSNRWFTKGIGQHSYTTDDGISANFNYGATTFDWANMLDTYTADATPAQKKAVATLMYACGVAVDMNYSDDESGAVAEFIPAALINYFGCDKGVAVEFRDYTPSQNEWDDMVYAQLRDNGPVIYNGSTRNNEGHSFVCDGYDGEGYFHINWGWGGLDDGFYILSVLDPGDNEGIGGAVGAFEFNQTMISGIGKPKANSKIKPVFTAHNGFIISEESAPLAGTVKVTSEISNWSAIGGNVTFGVIVVDANGRQYIGEGTQYKDFKPGYYIKEYSSHLPSGLPKGNYKIYPAVCLEGGSWTIVPAMNGTVSYYDMEVTDRLAKFTPQETARAEILNPAFTTPVYEGKYATVEAEIKNPTSLPFSGNVMLAIFDAEGTQVGYGEQMRVSLEPRESNKLTYTSEIEFVDDYDFREGTFTFCFFNATTLTQMSDPFTATVKMAVDPKLELTSFTLAGNPIKADKDNLVFNVSLKCVRGILAEPLNLVIFDAYTRRSVKTVSTETIYLTANESVTFDITTSLPAGKEGDKYIAALYIDNDQLSNPVNFTLATSGVDTLTDADEVLSMQVFTAAGVLVASSADGAADISALPSGVYILRAVTSSGAVKTRRIIK